MIQNICYVQNRQIHKGRKQIHGGRGWEVGEMEVTILGDRICLRDDKNILELDSCDDCTAASQVAQW